MATRVVTVLAGINVLFRLLDPGFINSRCICLLLLLYYYYYIYNVVISHFLSFYHSLLVYLLLLFRA